MICITCTCLTTYESVLEYLTEQKGTPLIQILAVQIKYILQFLFWCYRKLCIYWLHLLILRASLLLSYTIIRIKITIVISLLKKLYLKITNVSKKVCCELFQETKWCPLSTHCPIRISNSRKIVGVKYSRCI